MKCLLFPNQIKLKASISFGTKPRVNIMHCLSGKVDKKIKVVLCVFQKPIESEYNVISISEGCMQCFIQLLFCAA